ncbi:MAG: hypothetical protein HY657_07695 [Acidobacteria bacterium]|nr:hypothetical protein [Acidobacteriota bacterium]
MRCCGARWVLVALAAATLVLMVRLGAQEGRPTAEDPRVSLKAGFRDAGVAARNLELVATLPKPEGFFDPSAPAGSVVPPERLPRPGADPNEPEPAPPVPQPQPAGGGLNFGNSDLAFGDQYVFVGNFHGFTIYDVENPRRPRLVASVVCPGGQGDVSVSGNLLFMSVEQTRGRVDCGTQGVRGPVSAERFRGVRIFDIRDLNRPRQIAAVQTCRGSHTHTLVTKPGDTENLYVYASGTAAVRSEKELEGCSGGDPRQNPDTALFSIDVIQVPLASPQTATIVNRPRIFADPATGNIAGLWRGGGHGPGTQSSRATTQCHDITVFPEIGLAAGACAGNGILLDISDPANPVRLDQVVDPGFAYWHSATFNQDGTKVLFTDEWGGGTRPRCRATDPPTWGANAIFEIIDRRLRLGGYYKLPAVQTAQENCVAHNGSIIPVPGRDIMVQGWYQGGISVFDFTDPTAPFEIAYFDRGPIDPTNLITGGHWSVYWYNGHIYGTEIARGVDVLRLTPSEHLSQHEIDAAMQVRTADFNAQQQSKVVWPGTSAVARAYVDQLVRTNGIQEDRVRAIRPALDRADRVRARERGAAAVAAGLQALAKQVTADAEPAPLREATRLWSLAAALENRAASLR